jgi:hypothetical protein
MPRTPGLGRRRATDPIRNLQGAARRACFRGNAVIPGDRCRRRRSAVTLGPAGGELDVQAHVRIETRFRALMGVTRATAAGFVRQGGATRTATRGFRQNPARG